MSGEHRGVRRPVDAGPTARRLFGALVLVVLATPPAAAQELRVSALKMWPDHDLLGSPHGLGLAASARPFGRAGIRFGVEVSRDDFDSFGSTCVGLIPPDVDCSGEPRREEARVRTLSLTVPVTVASSGRLRLDLLPGLRTAWLESEQTGTVSGRTRSAEKAMYGYELGAEAGMATVRRGALRIHLSGHVGTLEPYREEIVADGYTPFERRIDYWRLQLGLSLTL